MKKEKQEVVLQAFAAGKYFCTEDGRVFSRVGREKQLCFSFKRGYPGLNIYWEKTPQTVYVHHLVWLYFKGAIPEGLQINHRNGDKQNNHIDNLEAVSPRINTQEAHRMGLVEVARGENHGSVVLTESAVREIRNSNDPQGVLAKRYGVSQPTICRVKSRKIWRHVA